MLIDHLKKTDDRALTKWHHYFQVYEREMGRFLKQPISFLEIGIFKGGSIPMWKDYFPDGSRLTFIDIDPACKAFEIEGTNVRIGNQADPEFLTSLAGELGPFDVVLDDGSHVCAHQIASFESLWQHLTNGGLYMVEDCHTSYWPGFGGGYRNEASFIEYSKRLIDTMHSWYTDQDALFPFQDMARELNSVRFYDSIVAIEKLEQKEPPTSLVSKNGNVEASRRALQVRGRTSVFAGKDGN
ncbi:class I SAM-dependent methyltransferase [Roseovarius nitratireducens]|uniref:class I SAM-dependent methyltransferase n=1 Tax=Roseovarius nitratireducens TaxID=2044597 RepID=UPI000CE23E62|nr:class I SAM-dependent methyltransferase [Roseovarius nitratireducens]